MAKTVPVRVFVCLAAVVAVLSRSAAAGAQDYEGVGIRAKGMAGAFVAVADDATASWWNPAGLATGAYLNSIIEFGHSDEGDESRAIAVAFPALGLSYYRLIISEIQPVSSTEASGESRQDQGPPGVGVRRLEVSQYGTTAGQSIGDHVVVASTLKIVRGGGTTTGDLDVGAMVHAGVVRVGIATRNLRAPQLGGAAGVTLHRETRAGVAFVAHSKGAIDDAVLDVDADLTKNVTATGDTRRAAAGFEVLTLRKQLGFRAGISINTIGDRRTAPSAGLSLAFRRGTFIDGQVTGGPDKSRSGWGLAARLTF